MAGGCVNKQGNLQGFVLGSHNKSRSLHLPTKILKVYVEALTVYVYHPDGLNNLFTVKTVLETASDMGKASGTYIPRTGEGREEPLIAQALLKDHVLLMTSSKTPHDWLLTILHAPSLPLSTVCPEQGVSPAWNWLVGSYLAILHAETIATM